MAIGSDRRKSCKSEISPNLLFVEKFRLNKDTSSELLELSHFRLIMDFRWFLFPIGVI